MGFTLDVTSYSSNTTVVFVYTATASLAADGVLAFNPTVTIANVGSNTPSGTAQVIPIVTSGTATPSAVQSFT